jgi:hypothetical protein
MCACRYLTVTVFAALALQALLQGQQCAPSSGRKAFHPGWPYTAQYREKQRPPLEAVVVVAEDSQGRFLYRYTSADGRSTSTVYDPVAAQEVQWDTSSMKAKILKYATPVAGRRSCWQSSWSERSAITGRTLSGKYYAFCAPAGRAQPAGCHDVCEAERLAHALPPEKRGFPKCDPVPEGTEDLGMEVIQGITAHGCRSTTSFPKVGNVLIENWSDDYGLTLRKIQGHSTDDRYFEELISLRREEPDLSIFQPPKGYEIVTLEMEEVPCEQPHTTINYWLSDLPIDARKQVEAGIK